ncbi:MAG: TIGR02221 family CRISPR-associated protein [Saprospiraceae bacterium]|nr:TIGR02221 family CRISPR-associated protein [Saprospiraceae bacterium]
MPRKIFLSFLGAIPYFPTKYYLEADRRDLSNEIYFVQEHLIRQHPGITEAITFTTDDARKNNYENRIERPRDQAPIYHEGQGLEGILKQLKAEGILNKYRSEHIPNGYSEAEIWEVFQVVYEQLNEGDMVVFDVTFGFRSLPMLVIVLLNYARTLKNIQVEAIYYGNYEAGKDEKTHKTMPHVEAPILRLDAFVHLQDWTHAAQSFMIGNVIPLSEITKEKHPDFSHEINAFAKAILTCRGLGLAEDVKIDELKTSVRQMSEQSDIDVVLQPLLNKVSAKISPFDSGQLSNGFAAVDWCIQHNMTQQGITFLQETLISYMVEKFLGQDSLINIYERELAGSALQLFPSKNCMSLDPIKNKFFAQKTDDEKRNTILVYEEMREFVKNKTPLRDLYKELVGKDGFRNDINHCGYRRPYLRPEELNEALRNLFEKIKSLNL